MYIESMQN